MKENYLCPHCRGFLNVGGNIIFVVKNNLGESGIIMLHSEIGNYQVTKHPLFFYEEGEHLEFFCPICHKKLASDIHDNLAKIIYVDEKRMEYNILFSIVAGEKSTFKMIGENVEVFGKHSDNYLDILGMR
jgi:uncharacterized protein YbaR (Trm112 family)